MAADHCLNKEPLWIGSGTVIRMVLRYSCYLAAGWFRIVFSLFFSFVFFFPPFEEGGERERQNPLTTPLSPRKIFKHLYGEKGLIFPFELCLITLSGAQVSLL